MAGSSGHVFGNLTPVALTPGSYTQDVIVEKNASTPVIPGGYTTASMDGGTANNGDTWNEIGFFADHPDTGLPVAGSTFVSAASADHSFTMAPSYTQNNAVMLDAGTTFASASVTLTTPAAFGALSFLTSGGNGGCIFRYTIHHADGTTETGTTPSADWFNGPSPAIITQGRVNAQSFSADNIGPDNPRLYGKDVTLSNKVSPITSIDLAYVSSASGAHTCIMAISGSPAGGGDFAPVIITGYNADIVVEASATKPQQLVGATTATMDGALANTGATWYEQGYNPLSPLTGLPPAGSTLTNASASDHTYTMAASYAANNAVYLDPTTTPAVITLASPSIYFGFSLLAATASGDVTLGYEVHHVDGTTETGTVVAKDWFNGTPAAAIVNGRVNVDNATLDNVNNNNPRIYAADFSITNTTSAVDTITLSFQTGADTATVAVFALSGSSGPLIPFFSTLPQAVKVSSGGSATFTALAGGTPPVGYKWQKADNGGVYADLSDSATVAGSATAELTLTGVTDATAGSYRVLASNGAGTATSDAAILTVLSALPIVTSTTDSVLLFNGASNANEGVEHSIDQKTDKYLNSGARPVGLVVTPSQGRTVVTALQFFTANDAPERDPADYKLEGSNDGGSSYTVVSSGPLALPTARNNGGADLDPVNQAIQQVTFANTLGYTTYRVSFANLRDNNSGLFQIGEVAILGVADTSGVPAITTQPLATSAAVGGNASFTIVANGTPSPALKWYKRTGPGENASLSDTGNVTGSSTATLGLSNVSFGDAGDYFAVASNTAGSATSSVVRLTIISTLQDITAPTDPITAFGDNLATPADPATAIDNTTSKYLNGGSGFSTTAGFPPFEGPVGFVVTPDTGLTIVTGLRIYAADGNPERDPGDYKLEGSANGGTSYSLISTGLVSLSVTRNASGLDLDPLTQSSQEILFANSTAFSTYRLTFTNTRDNTSANSLQVGEVEILGVPGGISGPSLAISFAGGSITITSSRPGILQKATALKNTGTTWDPVGPISAPMVIPATEAAAFYRVAITDP